MPGLDENYQQALDYLYSFVDYSLTRQLRYSPEKFNLERMYKLMTLMGNPQGRYPVIHIAGTKGKGSTAAMIASILTKSGYKVGLYTSPHLQDYTERIQVNGIPISHEEMVRQIEDIKQYTTLVEEITTFEITTAIGFQTFADAKIDIGVIEVGLGGRLDATNVVDPVVSVITSLSFDHMNILGDSITQIAGEKGGIIKPGKPVVLSPQWKEAREVIESICNEKRSPLTIIGKDLFYSQWSHSLESQSFLVWTKNEQEMINEYIDSGGRTDWKPVHFSIPLLGQHQIENAATAYATIDVVRNSGFIVTQQNIIDGFMNVKWPGRFEIVQNNPVVILDSAHNQDSALRLRLALDDYLNGKPIVLLFGASEDKDVQGMFSHLLPRVRQVVATQSLHPRAMDPDKLVELANQFGKIAIRTSSVEEGLSKALQLADNEAVIVVTGSIFIAAAAREIILNSPK